MGKLKKISIAFVGLIVLFYIVNLVTSGEIERVIPTSTVANDQPREETYMMMNEQELEELAIPWSYNDIVRNPEKYYGEILFIEGNVQYISKKGEDRYYLAIAKQCGSPAKFEQLICDYGVIDYSGKRILKGDHIQSYGTLSKIIEQWPRFQPAPVIKSSFLECFNCN